MTLARRRLGAALLLFAVLPFAVLPLWSQEAENLDDLFSDPVEDTVVVEIQTDHLKQFSTSEKIVISGSFTTTGGMIAGWTQWPDASSLGMGFDGAIGLTSSVKLRLDARPNPDFRLYGTMTTSMDPLVSASWSNFAFDELFADYTWQRNVFVRMGKHSITWGQGRLFKAITNIMADSSGGYALRASMPTVLDGVSVIGLLKDEYFDSGAGASYRQIGYAAKVDQVLLGTLLSLGGRYQIDEGLNAILSVKRTAWGLDLLADAVVHYHEAGWYPRVLVGFFKEWSDVRLYGEYYYTAAVAGVADHNAGLALGFNNIFGTPLDAGTQWIHSFMNGSGTVVAGLTWVPWKYITATLAVPVVYGDGSFFSIDDLVNTDSARRRIALAFGLKMAVSF